MKVIVLNLSITFLGFIALVLIYVMSIERTNEILLESITKSTQASNVTITKVFVNELLPDLFSTLRIHEPYRKLKKEELSFIDKRVRTFMLGTDILKIKVFNLQGTTQYSTEHKQIGQMKTENTSFQLAATGKKGSQITKKGEFSAIDGVVFDRDLVSSYLPIRNVFGAVVGVVEIYTDRTQAIRGVPHFIQPLNNFLLVSLVITAFLFAAQFWSLLIATSQKKSSHNARPTK
jgi:hypothetical protein